MNRDADDKARIAELEAALERVRNEAAVESSKAVSLVADLRAEIAQLRDALRWYSCVASEMGLGALDNVSANAAMLEMEQDAGKRAREALGEGES